MHARWFASARCPSARRKIVKVRWRAHMPSYAAFNFAIAKSLARQRQYIAVMCMALHDDVGVLQVRRHPSNVKRPETHQAAVAAAVIVIDVNFVQAMIGRSCFDYYPPGIWHRLHMFPQSLRKPSNQVRA